jgi:hypothetical protein
MVNRRNRIPLVSRRREQWVSNHSLIPLAWSGVGEGWEFISTIRSSPPVVGH